MGMRTRAARETCIRISKDIASIQRTIAPAPDKREVNKARAAGEQALVDSAVKRMGVKAWIASYETYTSA